VLSRRRTETRPEAGPALSAVKIRAIERAGERGGLASVVDLGGVWLVEGGYTFAALKLLPLTRAVLVDTGITPTVRRRAASEPRLRLVDGNFGDASVRDRVGPVDAALLFDVLLHQVAPDWDDVLRAWAAVCRCLVIVQPQWVGDETVRLWDLGTEGYLANVPRGQQHVDMSRLAEEHPRYRRPWRDIHELWQWGITNRDLHRVMTELGYRLVHYENAGQWQELERFESCAFVYLRGARRGSDL
jgi:hypothetical protein